MKRLLLAAVAFVFALRLSAVETGGAFDWNGIAPSLKRIAGVEWKAENPPKARVVVFFDPSTPLSQETLRLLDTICEQSRSAAPDFAFAAISRQSERRTKELFLNGFTLPVYVETKPERPVWGEYARTEVMIPFVLVEENGEVRWKGSPQELESVLHEMRSGTYRYDTQIKLESLRKELQNAIQTSLPQVILASADRILTIRPSDMIAIQAKLYVYESTNQPRLALSLLREINAKDKANADLRTLLLDYLIRNGEYELFQKEFKQACADFSGAPDKLIRLLAFSLQNAPFAWLPVREARNATAVLLKTYDGKGGRYEAIAHELAAHAACLSCDIETAVREQEKALAAQKGTEFEEQSRMVLNYYRSIQPK